MTCARCCSLAVFPSSPRWVEAVLLRIDRSFWELAPTERQPETGVGDRLRFPVRPAEEDPPSSEISAGGTLHAVGRAEPTERRIEGFGIIWKDQHRFHRAPQPHTETRGIVLSPPDLGYRSIQPRVGSRPGVVARLLPFREISPESRGEADSAPCAQRQADSPTISQADTGHSSRVHSAPVDGVRIALFSSPYEWEWKKRFKQTGKTEKKKPDQGYITGWTAKPTLAPFCRPEGGTTYPPLRSPVPNHLLEELPLFRVGPQERVDQAGLVTLLCDLLLDVRAIARWRQGCCRSLPRYPPVRPGRVPSAFRCIVAGRELWHRPMVARWLLFASC